MPREGRPISADLHTLTGAYALDALATEELAVFERHLAACEACRREVDEFAATAATLGAAAAGQAPTSLRAGVLARVDVIRQLPPAGPAEPDLPRGLRRRAQQVLAPVAAALAVAVVLLSGHAARLEDRVTELEAEVSRLGSDELTAVLSATDLQHASLEGSGAAVRFLWSPSLDRGVLVAEGLEPLPASSTYQLWLYHDGTARPTTRLEPDQAGTVAAEVGGAAAVRRAEFVAITVEPHGGSTAPTGDLVAYATL